MSRNPLDAATPKALEGIDGLSVSLRARALASSASKLVSTRTSRPCPRISETK